MVLILISWLYIFFTSLTLGIGFLRFFRIHSLQIHITAIVGLFAVTLLASSWAIFGPIHIGFHIFLLFLSLATGFYYKKDLKEVILATGKQFSEFSITLKIFCGTSSILILAQSAALPFILDNETYYIQTIKWLNGYGFVPGLANFHLFLGQTSGWHITQSVYSFSFLYERFNDLNGYLFLMGNYWAFQKLHSYFKEDKSLDLIFGLLPLTYVFLFQFISVPSPDFPVYILAFLVFSMYLEVQMDFDLDKFSLITIFVLFAVYIKITAIVLLILPLLFFVQYSALLKNQQVRLQLLSGTVLLLFVMKNIILTGYPFYPLAILPYSGADYAVPIEIMDYFFSPKMMHSFYMGFGAFEDASVYQFVKQYFLHSGIDSMIGLATVMLLVISPFVFSRFNLKQPFRNIYFAFIILLLLLVLSSPQYRFYIYFTIFFGLAILAVIIPKKLIVWLLGVSIFLTGILVFVPISYSGLTDNQLLENNSAFQWESGVFPQSNTKENLSYTKETKGNLGYHSPTQSELFWITGNGELPCVNSEQVNYFEIYFHVIPQWRGKTFGKGFYAIKNTTDD